MSPSVWREWIEIRKFHDLIFRRSSPSVWREWIEMQRFRWHIVARVSPSVWREWIEITRACVSWTASCVSLRVEGVD